MHLLTLSRLFSIVGNYGDLCNGRCSLIPEGILADQDVAHVFTVSYVSSFLSMSISYMRR
jgi:hypothetical protein